MNLQPPPSSPHHVQNNSHLLVAFFRSSSAPAKIVLVRSSGGMSWRQGRKRCECAKKTRHSREKPTQRTLTWRHLGL